jgi:hypothetical protein
MLEGDVIQVSDQARDIRRALFARTPSGMLLFLGSAAGVGLLPDRLLREFEFNWHMKRKIWFQRIPAICKSIRQFTPTILCSNPAATLSQLLL